MYKSFIVTGASASGKTTLINEAKKDYIYLPTHMTRKRRANEQDGIDGIFITDEEFIMNFNNGKYIEESLDFALLKSLSIYYGTPREWINFLERDGYCASPVSTEIASIIVTSCNVCWVHLYCSDKDRYERLRERGISENEINKRMKSGDSIVIPKSADLLVDTSKYSAQDILRMVSNHTK